MSRPRLLADEDLRWAIVLAVRRMEPSIDFDTVRESGLAGSTDPQVLEFAKAQGCIVVSHDVNTLRAEAETRVADGRGIAGVFSRRKTRRPARSPSRSC